MAKKFSKKFYNSKEWKKCRKAYKELKFGLCERCGAPGEHVHHRIYLTPNNINNPDVTLSFKNLELLCESCHTKEHNSKYSPLVEGLAFNSKGDLIQMGDYPNKVTLPPSK